MTTAVLLFPSGLTAEYDGETWTCADAEICDILNQVFNRQNYDDAHTLSYSPNIVADVAEWTAEQVGAKLVRVPDTITDPGEIY